jgi:hypothetical protein
MAGDALVRVTAVTHVAGVDGRPSRELRAEPANRIFECLEALQFGGGPESAEPESAEPERGGQARPTGFGHGRTTTAAGVIYCVGHDRLGPYPLSRPLTGSAPLGS